MILLVGVGLGSSARPRSRAGLKTSNPLLGVPKVDGKLIDAGLEVVPGGLGADELLSHLAEAVGEIVDTLLSLPRVEFLPELQLLPLLDLGAELALRLLELRLEAVDPALGLPPGLGLGDVPLVH